MKRFLLSGMLLALPRMVLAFGLRLTPFEIFLGFGISVFPFSLIIGFLLAKLIKRRYHDKHPGERFFLQQFFIVIGTILVAPLVILGILFITDLIF